jgi:hypothetical protein
MTLQVSFCGLSDTETDHGHPKTTHKVRFGVSLQVWDGGQGPFWTYAWPLHHVRRPGYVRGDVYHPSNLGHYGGWPRLQTL